MNSWPVSLPEDIIARGTEDLLSLRESEAKVYSQNGEDGIIFEVLKRLGAIDSGNFLEFGVGDGTETCCRLLLDHLNWNGVYIESNLSYFNGIVERYNGNSKLKALNQYVSNDNINNIISSNFTTEPDLIVIDIDGLDYQIFNAIESRPKLFVVEYNGSLPLDRSLVSTNRIWDESGNYGASIAALKKIGLEKGYTLIHTDLTGVNSFFIRNDFVHLFPESKNPILQEANLGLIGYVHPGLDLSHFIDY